MHATVIKRTLKVELMQADCIKRSSNLESAIGRTCYSFAFHADIPTLADRIRNIIFVIERAFSFSSSKVHVVSNLRIKSTVVSKVLDAPALLVSSVGFGRLHHHFLFLHIYFTS